MVFCARTCGTERFVFPCLTCARPPGGHCDVDFGRDIYAIGEVFQMDVAVWEPSRPIIRVDMQLIRVESFGACVPRAQWHLGSETSSGSIVCVRPVSRVCLELSLLCA